MLWIFFLATSEMWVVHGHLPKTWDEWPVSRKRLGPTLQPSPPVCIPRRNAICIESRVEALKSSEIFGAVSGAVRAPRSLSGGRDVGCEPGRQARPLAAEMMPQVWPDSPGGSMVCGQKHKPLCFDLWMIEGCGEAGNWRFRACCVSGTLWDTSCPWVLGTSLWGIISSLELEIWAQGG